MHQIHNTTKHDRYPEIFQQISTMCNPTNILSFGCSSGEEVFTLKDKYFQNAKIFGVDISQECIDTANRNNKYNDVFFSNKIPNEKFDLIFAMSVFCHWPESNSDEYDKYTFSIFENEAKQLTDMLNINGLLVIYNSQYYFEETESYEKYESIKISFSKEVVKKRSIKNSGDFSGNIVFKIQKL